MAKKKFTERWAINYPESPELGKINWSKYQQFKENWAFSYANLTKLNNALNSKFDGDNNFLALVAGSYARMDAHEKSDLDFMIIHNGHLEDEASKIKIIREVASDLKIGLPNPEGVFSKPVKLDDMIESIGAKDDNLIKTAQRLLILMECRPIYNEIFYKNIMGQFMDHYLRLVSKEPEKEAVVLLNDLIKYFRNICINVEFSFWQDEEKWGIRNIKLRHSRVLIYSGLLFLIINSSKYGTEKSSYIRNNIALSPIEKVFSVYNDNNDFNFSRILGAYNNFLHKMTNDEVRNELATLDYADRYNSSNYAELKTNSDFLQAELTRFLLDNRGKWSSKIFEYLIF